MSSPYAAQNQSKTTGSLERPISKDVFVESQRYNISGTVSITETELHFFVDLSTTATITLPNVAASKGKEIVLNLLNRVSACTIQAANSAQVVHARILQDPLASDTLTASHFITTGASAAASVTIPLSATAGFGRVVCVSNGTNWFISGFVAGATV